MMASTVFQTWPCQTWPCQLPGANVVASPKIPSLPAHWYAATSVKPTAPSKTSAETTARPSQPTMPHAGPFDYGPKIQTETLPSIRLVALRHGVLDHIRSQAIVLQNSR